MAAIAESIITSARNCNIYEAENGSMFECYKSPAIAPRTLACIGEDFLVGAEAGKPNLLFWTFSRKVKQVVRMTVSGIISVLTVSSCGTYLVAGIKKEMYIWKVSTGELLAIVSRHMQDITCIKFNVGDSHIITGGKDGHVHVWSLSRLVSISTTRHIPLHSWSHHSAAVTDIHVTALGQFARVVTTSHDMTCRIYELSSGALICTICMDTALTTVTMDPLENLVFIGNDKGSLFKINMYNSFPKEIQSHHLKDSKFRIHMTEVVSLGVSFDGTRVVSASADDVIILNITTMAKILTIRSEGLLTNAFILLKPLPLIDQKLLPQFCISQFQRQLDTTMKDAGLKKISYSNSYSTPISKMIDLNPELAYDPSRYNMESSETDSRLTDDRFQRTLNTETVNDIVSTNNQLYSYLHMRAFENLEKNIDTD